MYVIQECILVGMYIYKLVAFRFLGPEKKQYNSPAQASSRAAVPTSNTVSSRARTFDANLVRNRASSMALSPPPTTITYSCVKSRDMGSKRTEGRGRKKTKMPSKVVSVGKGAEKEEIDKTPTPKHAQLPSALPGTLVGGRL